MAGQYSDLFHEHVPKNRISDDASTEMMKALVLRHMEVEAQYILRCYLNNCGQDPQSYNPFQIHVEYPEPGVLRKYCGTDILAWLDTVIIPEEFRRTATAVK